MNIRRNGYILFVGERIDWFVNQNLWWRWWKCKTNFSAPRNRSSKILLSIIFVSVSSPFLWLELITIWKFRIEYCLISIIWFSWSHSVLVCHSSVSFFQCNISCFLLLTSLHCTVGLSYFFPFGSIYLSGHRSLRYLFSLPWGQDWRCCEVLIGEHSEMQS